jgi:hypothetical protein
MKTFELKKDSWHYKAASFYYGGWMPEESDICWYARKVIMGCLVFAILAGILITVTSVVGYGLAESIWVLIMGGHLSNLAQGVLSILAIFSIAAVLVFGGIFAKIKINEWKENAAHEHRQEKNPGFLYLMYAKFKEKTCAKIILK